jgi:hypothetical protein
MRKALGAIATLAALIATDASAQVLGVDLNGPYRCVAGCLGPPGRLAFVTQYGWQLNVVNDAGQPSRGHVDYPGRIWLYQANQGAIYSPDGLTIQFDGGTVWRRVLALPPPRRLAGGAVVVRPVAGCRWVVVNGVRVRRCL